MKNPNLSPNLFNRKFFLILMMGILFQLPMTAQNPEWKNYTSESNINIFLENAKVGGHANKWIGSKSGLAKYAEAWEVYDTTNSGLTNNNINAIAFDKEGIAFIGTGEYHIGSTGGLTKFDGIHWTTYNTGNSGLRENAVFSVAVDSSNKKWIGTLHEGLVIYNDTIWEVFNRLNSSLPSNFINSISIDSDQNGWLGIPEGNFSSKGGLVKYDGLSWNYYNSENSELPFNEVSALAIDHHNHVWVGCGQNLVEFDGTNMTVFNSQNSQMPNQYINAIAIDTEGAKWIGLHGLEGGLLYFKGTDWKLYKTDNSKIPFNHIRCIAIGANGNVWIGSNVGLAKFDGENWELFDTSNSELPSNEINTISIDSWNNIWIGTIAGLVILDKKDELGTSIANAEIDLKKPTQAELFQNYPNPFNYSTTINYSIKKPGKVVLKIYNYLGKEEDILVNAFQTIGEYEISWKPNKLSRGIYFYTLQVGEFLDTKKLYLQ